MGVKLQGRMQTIYSTSSWVCTRNAAYFGVRSRGIATGGYRDISPPPKKKSAQVNFYGVKMTSERLFNSFIPPPQKKNYTPKTNFWLRPCFFPPNAHHTSFEKKCGVHWGKIVTCGSPYANNAAFQ